MHPLLALGQLRHAVIGQHLLDEAAVLLGDRGPQHLLELLRVDLAHALVLARDDDVDAVRLVADVLVDPVAFDFELLRREADGAQNAEAAGAADGRDHVAAVAEGEDGEFDSETVTEGGMHCGMSCLGSPGSAGGDDPV